MLILLVVAVTLLALYVCVTLRSKVVLLEADAMLLHGRIAALRERIDVLEQENGISYHQRGRNSG